MRWNRFQLCMGKGKKRGQYAPAHSCKYVTILKVPSNTVIGDEPLKILLKYAVSESVAEFVDECIQTRFGGVGLPTAIKDLKEIVTYSGNVVAVQVYLRLLRFGAVSNTGVSIAPILVSLDGAVHQCFNLTHVVKMGGDLFDSFNIGHGGSSCNPLCATTSSGWRLLPLRRRIRLLCFRSHHGYRHMHHHGPDACQSRCPWHDLGRWSSRCRQWRGR